MSLVYRALRWEELTKFATLNRPGAAEEVLRRIGGDWYVVLSREALLEQIDSGYQEGYEAGYKDSEKNKDE